VKLELIDWLQLQGEGCNPNW